MKTIRLFVLCLSVFTTVVIVINTTLAQKHTFCAGILSFKISYYTQPSDDAQSQSKDAIILFFHNPAVVSSINWVS